MKVKLADRFCSHVKADSRVDYFDEVTTGLAMRVTEAGSKSWTCISPSGAGAPG